MGLNLQHLPLLSQIGREISVASIVVDVKCPNMDEKGRYCTYCIYYLRQGGIKIATVCLSFCPSVLPSVRPSVGPSVRPSVRLLAGLR